MPFGNFRAYANLFDLLPYRSNGSYKPIVCTEDVGPKSQCEPGINNRKQNHEENEASKIGILHKPPSGRWAYQNGMKCKDDEMLLYDTVFVNVNQCERWEEVTIASTRHTRNGTKNHIIYTLARRRRKA